MGGGGAQNGASERRTPRKPAPRGGGCRTTSQICQTKHMCGRNRLFLSLSQLPSGSVWSCRRWWTAAVLQKNLLGALAPASDVAAWLYQSRVCESRFGPDAICAMKRRASMCRWSCPCLRTCLGRLSMSGVRSMPGPCAAGAVFDLVL